MWVLTVVVVFSVLLYPSVLGQSVEFEQECHILKTLDALETRLNAQDTRLKLQEKLLDEQKAQLEQQNVSLAEQRIQLEQQNVSLAEQRIQLEQQNVSLAEQRIQLEKQNVSLAEQRIQLEQQNVSLAEQRIQLEKQNVSLAEQRIQLEQQRVSLATQKTHLEKQNVSHAEQRIQLEQQNVSLAEQRIQLKKQQVHIRELEVKVNASDQSTRDPNVGFTVYSPKDTNTTGRITFNNVLTNSGDGFNTTTGEFTCSVAGSYSFTLTVTLYKTAHYVQCGIIKDARQLGSIYVNPYPAKGYFPASVTVYKHLLPGDKVYLGNCSPAASMGKSSTMSSFTGYLVNID